MPIRLLAPASFILGQDPPPSPVTFSKKLGALQSHSDYGSKSNKTPLESGFNFYCKNTLPPYCNISLEKEIIIPITLKY
jgi:hypothetical protein